MKFIFIACNLLDNTVDHEIREIEEDEENPGLPDENDLEQQFENYTLDHADNVPVAHAVMSVENFLEIAKGLTK